MQIFQDDAFTLFLGAAIAAMGLVAAAFAALRRRSDPLLVYFALFAVLYGMRMWIQTRMLRLAFQYWSFYPSFRSAIDYLVPIPAFLFFNSSGLLHRQAKVAGYVLGIGMAVLALATLLFGPRAIYHQINNVLVIAALIAVVAGPLRADSANQDFVVMRRGLLIFVAFAFWENVQGMLGWGLPSIEPIGFVVFLASLGYVAARRILQRDHQLSEIRKELEVAKRIQLSILPGQFPNSASFRVAARYVPMTSVAGDFYDFIVADDRQAGLLIADVSGHGVPAALIASMVKLAATSQRENAADPSALLGGMNLALLGNTQQQFVTAAYVHLDSASKRFTYSAAAHPPMLLLRRGKVQEIVENGLMLAAFDFSAYSNTAHALEPGDRLLLYTDGLVEAANVAGEFFGQESLRALLQNTAELAPSEAADRIVHTVQQWAASQEDDLTVLVCDYAAIAL
ncbi:MAG TPA: PP2C family protein-serine/threonine phosphatase [Candidatus Sulfotelmatobacter sp.]